MHPPSLQRLFRPQSAPQVAALALVALSAAGGLTAVSVRDAEHGPHPVAVAETQRLTSVRFNTYETGPDGITVSLDNSDEHTRAQGLLGHRGHHVDGRCTAGRQGARTRSLPAWGTRGSAVATIPAQHRDDDVRDTVHHSSPRARSPRADTSEPLDSVLRLAMSLRNNRPDNARLLAQAGPRHLHEATMHGTAHTVCSGPRPRGAAARVGTVGTSP